MEMTEKEINQIIEEILTMSLVQKYKEETNTTFNYVMALPGLKREDIEIKAMLEKDFFTVLVNIQNTTNFVQSQTIRIVKSVNDVVTDKETIGIEIKDGILTISLLKKNPITEYEL